MCIRMNYSCTFLFSKCDPSDRSWQQLFQIVSLNLRSQSSSVKKGPTDKTKKSDAINSVTYVFFKTALYPQLGKFVMVGRADYVSFGKKYFSFAGWSMKVRPFAHVGTTSIDLDKRSIFTDHHVNVRIEYTIKKKYHLFSASLRQLNNFGIYFFPTYFNIQNNLEVSDLV